MAAEMEFDRWGRMFYDPSMHPDHGNPWLNSDQAYLIEHYDAQGPEEVSMALGRTIKAVQAKACELRKKGLMPPTPNARHRRLLKPQGGDAGRERASLGIPRTPLSKS